MSGVSVGWLAGHGGRPIFARWLVPERPRGSVLVVHGYAEHGGRYVPILRALAAQGLASLAPDHRGHGRSARVRGDLEGRELVLSDLVAAHRQLLALAGGPVFVLAHSLGAVFALRALERGGEGVAGAVLNGVALAVPANIPVPLQLLASGLARVAPTFPLRSYFDARRNTRDADAQRAMVEDPLFWRGPIRARTGVEVAALIAETRAELARVRVPVLLTHGGADRHVPVSVAEATLSALGSADRSLVVFPGLLHETWQEPERDEVVGRWLSWIGARVSQAG